MWCLSWFQKTGIADLIPGTVIDDFLFDPCGYSMNGLLPNVSYTLNLAIACVIKCLNWKCLRDSKRSTHLTSHSGFLSSTICSIIICMRCVTILNNNFHLLFFTGVLLHNTHYSRSGVFICQLRNKRSSGKLDFLHSHIVNSISFWSQQRINLKVFLCKSSLFLKMKEVQCSWFVFQDTYEDLIASVLDIFKPGKFLMTLMANEVNPGIVFCNFSSHDNWVTVFFIV